VITFPWSKIETVVPASGDRPTLEDVWFDKGKSQLVATDGFILAVIPVDSQEGDVEGHIPMDAIKEGRRKARDSRLYIGSKQATVWVEFNGEKEYERPDLPFPDYEQIVPSYNPDDDDVVQICLDARRLMQLAEALCQQQDRANKNGTKKYDAFGVTLTAKKGGICPILVHPIWDNGKRKGRYGVIMPMPKVGR
jgi:hypothetical protein